MTAEGFRDALGADLLLGPCPQLTRLGFSPCPRHFPFAFRLTKAAENPSDR